VPWNVVRLYVAPAPFVMGLEVCGSLMFERWWVLDL